MSKAGGDGGEDISPLQDSGSDRGGGWEISPLQDSGSGRGGVSNLIRRQNAISRAALFMGVAFFSCLILLHATYPFQFISSSFHFINNGTNSSQGIYDIKLEKVLKNASMEDGTVILTTLNDAWLKPNSLIDVFLESFRIGNNTQRFLNHLVIIAMDEKAYNRCLAIHPHCYAIHGDGVNNSTSEAYYMTPVYLQMMWTRIQLLGNILEMGYNFVFTDADVMWLRDPFPQFFPYTDFQIACDVYIGDSFNRNNPVNGGFKYVKSNNRTIEFYKFWYVSRETYPKSHDQDVLNKIKSHPLLIKIRLTMRFLDTAYFGGFCQPSKDFDKVCTMHANCCLGLEHKLNDLNLVLEDWRKYMSLRSNAGSTEALKWTAPQKCP